MKEELLKENYQNNRIYSKISKDLNNGNNNIDDDKKENDIVLKDKNNEEKNNQIKNNFKKNLKYKIQKLGGELIEEEKDMFNADFFLTDFYEENNPIFKNIENYKEKKIPILHCHYIEICLMYFFNVKIEDFILNENNKYLKFLDLNQVFEKNKGDIVNFYGNNEFIDEN